MELIKTEYFIHNSHDWHVAIVSKKTKMDILIILAFEFVFLNQVM